MALDANTLAGLIKDAVDNIDFSSGGIANDEVLLAFSQAIITHIQTNAEVVIGSGSSAGTYGIT